MCGKASTKVQRALAALNRVVFRTSPKPNKTRAEISELYDAALLAMQEDGLLPPEFDLIMEVDDVQESTDSHQKVLATVSAEQAQDSRLARRRPEGLVSQFSDVHLWKHGPYRLGSR